MNPSNLDFADLIDYCPICKSKNIDIFVNDKVSCRECGKEINLHFAAEMIQSQKIGTPIIIEEFKNGN
jgi:uncharacterized protein (DUF983 family)